MSNDYFSWEIEEFKRELKLCEEQIEILDNDLGYFAARAANIVRRGEKVPRELRLKIEYIDERLLLKQLEAERYMEKLGITED